MSSKIELEYTTVAYENGKLWIAYNAATYEPMIYQAFAKLGTKALTQEQALELAKAALEELRNA